MNPPIRVGEAVRALLGEWAEYPSTPEHEAKCDRWAEQERRKQEAQDLDDLKSMAHKAESGVYGKACQDLARDYMAANAASRMNLEALRQLLRKVPGRVSG